MRCAPRVPYPQPAQSGPFSTLHAPPPPLALPARISPLFLRFLCYSAGRVSVQPAAELRHVQRHEDKRHVFGALLACPSLSSHSRGLLALLAPPPAPRHSPSPHAASLAMLPFFTRQSASAFNQPLSFDTSSVMSTSRMFQVRSARSLPSAPTVEAFPARCMRRRRPHALPPPDPHVSPLVLPLLLGRARRRSTSR